MCYKLCYTKGIIGVCLIICGFIGRNCSADTSTQAVKAAWGAFYKYNGYDSDMNRFLAQYENKLSDDQKKYGGYAYFCARVALDKQISFKWTFP